MTPPALRVASLAAPFGDAPGLSDISFEVGAGGRFGIVGASGSGKTTLLRAIAGLGPASGGRVEIGGRDVTSAPPERRDAVYLHQTPLLFPHLSVFENVAFPLRIRRLPAAEVRRRVEAALAIVQLEALAERRPRTLSGGQRHRAALARAVVARPSVLLLDEPLSALDPVLRDEVRQALLALQGTYRPALVIVTHDLDEAGLLADRIGVLLGGRLAQIASPAELFTRPASLDVARFLGIPNRVAGTVLPGGRFESALGVLPLNGLGPLPPPGPAVAVFRPEALRPVQGAPLMGEVREIRHRLRETTVIVRIGDLLLEARVDPAAVPAPGTQIGLAVASEAIEVLPAS